MAKTTANEWQVALPLTLFFMLFFIAPLALLLSVSFYNEPQMLTNGLQQYADFFSRAINFDVLLDTLILGAKATLLCLVFAYPIAWTITKASARWQSILIFIVILPILTSVVVRSFAWIVMLSRQGIINQTLLALGLVDEPLSLLFSETGVLMVLAQVQMPLMVLPLMTNLQQIDPNLVEASSALGAGSWRTFWKVIFPLSLPGIIAGSILVYAASVTAFVTQTLIGGARLLYMPLFIYQEALDLQNWPFAAALSVIFMASVLLVVAALNVVGRASKASAL